MTSIFVSIVIIYLALFIVTFILRIVPTFVVNFFSNLIISFIEGPMRSFLMSTYEWRLILAISPVILILGAVIATSSDDLVDSILLGLFFFIISSLFLSLFFLLLSLLFSLSSVSGGEAWRRVSTSDLSNIVLSLVRIILCWARYIIYDIQVDGIDLALHYTDELFDDLNNNSCLFYLEITLDFIFSLLQILLSLFKIVIASFLVWLILDLFILRPILFSISSWLTFWPK